MKYARARHLQVEGLHRVKALLADGSSFSLCGGLVGSACISLAHLQSNHNQAPVSINSHCNAAFSPLPACLGQLHVPTRAAPGCNSNVAGHDSTVTCEQEDMYETTAAVHSSTTKPNVSVALDCICCNCCTHCYISCCHACDCAVWQWHMSRQHNVDSCKHKDFALGPDQGTLPDQSAPQNGWQYCVCSDVIALAWRIDLRSESTLLSTFSYV